MIRAAARIEGIEGCSLPGQLGKDVTLQAKQGKGRLGGISCSVLLIFGTACGRVPDEYTGSSIYVVFGQELGPQGNDAS